MDTIGLKLVEVQDVTKEAVLARDLDKKRIDAYAEQCFEAFHAFRIPFIAKNKKDQADWALKNFARNPGTRLYENMVDGTDAYKVALIQKVA